LLLVKYANTEHAHTAESSVGQQPSRLVSNLNMCVLKFTFLRNSDFSEYQGSHRNLNIQKVPNNWDRIIGENTWLN
jgi:hypothetical protein